MFEVFQFLKYKSKIKGVIAGYLIKLFLVLFIIHTFRNISLLAKAIYFKVNAKYLDFFDF